jgi:hypothetical protein
LDCSRRKHFIADDDFIATRLGGIRSEHNKKCLTQV